MTVDEKKINEIFINGYNKFTVQYNNEEKKFKTFNSFQKFIEYEVEYWTNYTSGNFNLQPFYNVFNNIKIEISRFEGIADENEIVSAFQRIHNYTNQKQFIPSDSELAKFLSRLYKEDKNSASTAYNYLFSKDGHLPRFEFKNQFDGILKAYSFINQDECISSKELVSQRIDQYSSYFQKEINKIIDAHSKLERKYYDALDRNKNDLSLSKTKFDTQITEQKKYL